VEAVHSARQTGAVPSWSALTAAAPELAAAVRTRFGATGLGFLATLRRNGFPRISGIEPLFTDQDLWLGTMPESRKGADLRRDPRPCLHSASAYKAIVEGDAKLTGRAVLVEGGEDIKRFRKAFATATGYGPPPGPMDLFRVDVTVVSLLRPGGDHLVIEWWAEGGDVRRVKRS
jgi:hypothetical protein